MGTYKGLKTLCGDCGLERGTFVSEDGYPRVYPYCEQCGVGIWKVPREQLLAKLVDGVGGTLFWVVFGFLFVTCVVFWVSRFH